MTTTANDQLEGLGAYKFGWADPDIACLLYTSPSPRD